MATIPGRSRCVACGKEKATLRCGGCLKEFCYNDFGNHRQELSKKLDEVEVNRDIFRQTLTEQTSDPQKHALIEQINKWEHDSMEKIRHTAEETRQIVFKHTTRHTEQLESRLNKLTNQLKESREENDFFETDLHRWNDELTRLTEELAGPSNIIIRQDAIPLITKIYVDIISASVYSPEVSAKANWVQNGITVAGGNEKGDGFNQLDSPLGVYVDDDQTIYIADWLNHRIVEWTSGASSGQVVAGGNGSGNRVDQLHSPTDIVVDKTSDCFIIASQGNRRIVRWPRQNGTSGQTIISNVECWGLAMDKDGCLYVSDCNKHEVKQWRIGDTSGAVVAGGNGQGNRLDQLNRPTHIFVSGDYSVYVSDSNNHRVMKWMKGAKEGIVVAGGQGEGDSLQQLSSPEGMVIDQLGTVYVADHDNHRIMRWFEKATQGTVILAGNGRGGQANQLQHPTGLSFDRQGNFYIVDMSNHRVQKFSITSS